ncbi:MAG TPA: FUSC family protein [Bradyrhizobium sp.]|nr:FUSC family protein [Bradyrhizobium sp.]
MTYTLPARRRAALVNAASVMGPPLLFGLRLWASVCLALYVAFWLQLDNAYWAGTSAAIVCQPRLGASMRKAWFRMIGTLVGAVAIVLLTALFPQNRAAFLAGLAIWGAACALATTLLRNFAAYAAALAGYTAAIIASDQLGATGGANGEAFTLAITRVSEIWIGIVSAGIVLAGTDFGAARRRLSVFLSDLSAEIARQFVSTLTLPKQALPRMQAIRRDLVRSVVALDPVIDEAIGESSDLRYRSPVLQAAVDGLFAALAGWHTVAARLARLPDEVARRDAGEVLRELPPELWSGPARGEPAPWLAEPVRLHQLCDASVHALAELPADTPSLKLLADQSSAVLSGVSDALDGLALLVADPTRRRSSRDRVSLHIPDWAPAFVNAGRALVVIAAVELFWIASAWPNGALAITWTAISVIYFASRTDEAYSSAMRYAVGTGLAAVGAAVVLFAVLPNLETFASFSIALGLYLVPVGALVAQPWQAEMFAPMAGNFVPLAGPANQMSYDTVQFYNNALAIVTGNMVAALSFLVLPPLSARLRTQQLLALTLRDLRRLAPRPLQRSSDNWQGHIFSRLAVLPNEATPLQRAQLVAALSVGTEIAHLLWMTPPLGFEGELDSALGALAQGHGGIASARLAAFDRRLASIPDSDPRISSALRARGRILVILDALVEHRAYFEEGAPG